MVNSSLSQHFYFMIYSFSILDFSLYLSTGKDDSSEGENDEKTTNEGDMSEHSNGSKEFDGVKLHECCKIIIGVVIRRL